MRPVSYAPAYVELFGGEPCETCAPELLRPFLTALRARVHNGRERPSERAAPPTAEQRRLAAEWAAKRAVTASAGPVPASDEAAYLRKRRAQVETRLKTALREGDRGYVRQLQAQLKAL